MIIIKIDLDLEPCKLWFYTCRHDPRNILHQHIEYRGCSLKTCWTIASKQKCSYFAICRSLILLFDLVCSKFIGMLLSLFCTCVWNMKTVDWKLFQLLPHNRSILILSKFARVRSWTITLKVKLYGHADFF